jgi:hypothetical protein
MALTNAERQAKHRARRAKRAKIALTAWEIIALESALMAAATGCVSPPLEPISARALLDKLAQLVLTREG